MPADRRKSQCPPLSDNLSTVGIDNRMHDFREERSMIRLIPNQGEPQDVEQLLGINELIQARIDGRISRRALIRRGTKLGMSAPLIGIMLHATSDYASGAPINGR